MLCTGLKYIHTERICKIYAVSLITGAKEEKYPEGKKGKQTGLKIKELSNSQSVKGKAKQSSCSFRMTQLLPFEIVGRWERTSVSSEAGGGGLTIVNYGRNITSIGHSSLWERTPHPGETA